MNTTNISLGHFYKANYYRFIPKTEEYANPISFRYKTYDDVQYRETRNQPMGGTLGSKFTLSIKTYARLPFKTKDKIELDIDNNEYIVTAIGQLHNTTTSLTNVFFTKRMGNKPILLHLNKDDV